MKNTLAWPYLRFVKRLLIVLTFGCGIYMVYFLFTMYRNPVFQDDSRPVKDTVMDAPALELDLKPDESWVALIQTRDIFSSGTADTSVLGQTPTGQLPSHLKVVGIVIANPPQVIIEDTSSKQTYFISEGKLQAGIRITRVDKNQIIVNYEGQNISVPIHKETKTTSVVNAPIP